MRLEDEQYEEIKRTVIDTFSVYGIRCIPISAFEMATKMGIKVIQCVVKPLASAMGI